MDAGDEGLAGDFRYDRRLSGDDRLGGDAADAPLVTQRGTRNQFVTGLFLSYTWGGGPRR